MCLVLSTTREIQIVIPILILVSERCASDEDMRRTPRSDYISTSSLALGVWAFSKMEEVMSLLMQLDVLYIRNPIWGQGSPHTFSNQIMPSFQNLEPFALAISTMLPSSSMPSVSTVSPSRPNLNIARDVP